METGFKIHFFKAFEPNTLMGWIYFLSQSSTLDHSATALTFLNKSTLIHESSLLQNQETFILRERKLFRSKKINHNSCFSRHKGQKRPSMAENVSLSEPRIYFMTPSAEINGRNLFIILSTGLAINNC